MRNCRQSQASVECPPVLVNKGSASHLHLYNIAMEHVQDLAIVITVCVQTSWESLLHMMVFAQAISVHGRIVCLTNTLSLHIQTCLANPAKQHTKNSCSGWSKRATRGYQSDYEDQSRYWEDHKAKWSVEGKLRRSPRLWLWHKSRLSRTATRVMDEPLRTAQLALRTRSLPRALRRQRLRRKKLSGRGWVNSIVC